MSKNFKQQAFTLAEVVIAISIMSLIFLSAYKALSQISESKALIDDEREIIQIANTMLSRLSRELQMALQAEKLIDPDYEDYYFYGEDRKLSNGEAGDRIIFVANEAGQYVPEGLAHSGLVMLSYRVEKNPERKNNTEQETYLLIRDEIPNLRPAEQAMEGRMTFPITDKLLSMDLHYFDYEGQSWSANWEEEESIPAMIRIKVRLQTNMGKIMTFATAVPIKAGVRERQRS